MDLHVVWNVRVVDSRVARNAYVAKIGYRSTGLKHECDVFGSVDIRHLDVLGNIRLHLVAGAAAIPTCRCMPGCGGGRARVEQTVRQRAEHDALIIAISSFCHGQPRVRRLGQIDGLTDGHSLLMLGLVRLVRRPRSDAILDLILLVSAVGLARPTLGRSNDGRHDLGILLVMHVTVPHDSGLFFQSDIVLDAGDVSRYLPHDFVSGGVARNGVGGCVVVKRRVLASDHWRSRVDEPCWGA
jgi:hypothetical protein